jgi:hypothetical protein
MGEPQANCQYLFPKDGVQGDVQVIEDERGVKIVVTPYFNSPSDRPVLAYVQVLDSAGKVLRRETDRISGSTGRRQIFNSDAKVRPAFERPEGEDVVELPRPPKKVSK